MLVNSIPNHPWIGKMLYLLGRQFLGIIEEVSDDGISDFVYVKYTYNDGEVDCRYVDRNSTVLGGLVCLLR